MSETGKRRKSGGDVQSFSEGYKLRGVEIFGTGVHRGQDYSEKDLAQIVHLFDKFASPDSPDRLLRNPAVIGHEEDQEYLKRTDLPAAGWVTRVYVEGDKLKADVEGVPSQVARLLNGGAYRTVSAEVYDTPPDGIPAPKGSKMLRRVAFLGGEIPEVKGLADIPTPEAYSETAPSSKRQVGPLEYAGRVHVPEGGFWACFSEATGKRKPKVRRPASIGKHSDPWADAGEDEIEGTQDHAERHPRPRQRVSTGAGEEGRVTDTGRQYVGGEPASTVAISSGRRGRPPLSAGLYGDREIRDDRGKRFGAYDEAGDAPYGRHKDGTPANSGDAIKDRRRIGTDKLEIARRAAAGRALAGTDASGALMGGFRYDDPPAPGAGASNRGAYEHDLAHRRGYNQRRDEIEGGGAQDHAERPSNNIAPDKARKILVDGSVNGRPLTEAQRKMFGAAASRKNAEGDIPVSRRLWRGGGPVTNKQHDNELTAVAAGRRSGHPAVEVLPRRPIPAEWRKGAAASRKNAEGDLPLARSYVASLGNKQEANEAAAVAAGRRGGTPLLDARPHRPIPEGWRKGAAASKKNAENETEATDMREQYLKKLAEYQFNSEIADQMPDPQLKETVDTIERGRSPMDDDDEDQWPMPAEDEDRQEFGRKMSEKLKKWAERHARMVRKYREAGCYVEDEDEDEEADGMDEDADRERRREEVEDEEEEPPMRRQPMKMSERAKKDLEATRELRQFSEQKLEKVDDLIEKLSEQGKLPPSQKRIVRERLLRADSVTKFSEGAGDGKGGNKQQKLVTEFDLQVRELKALPSMFGERFKQPVKIAGSADDEAEAVKEHFAAFSEGFLKNGITEEKLVTAFESRRKAQPGLTAERFLAG